MDPQPKNLEDAKQILYHRRSKLLREGRRVDTIKRVNKKQEKAHLELKAHSFLSADAVARAAWARLRTRQRHRQTERAKEVPSLRKYADRELLDASKCLLVLRSSQIFPPAREVATELNCLRIRPAGTGILMRHTPEALRRLRSLHNEVLYGLISAETVRKLLTSKAYLYFEDRSLDAPAEEDVGKPETAGEKTEEDLLREEELKAASVPKPESRKQKKKRTLHYASARVEKMAEFKAKVEADLVARRRKALPLSTNLLVEEEFADEGLICIEDLVHELVTGGEAFEKIASRLEPFVFDKLTDVEDRLQKARYGFVKELDKVVTKIL